jgi:hypothetical protein
MGFSPDKAKRHLGRRLFENGARYYATIGLKMRKNIENWDIK